MEKTIVRAESLLKDIDWIIVSNNNISSNNVLKLIPSSAPWWGRWQEKLIFKKKFSEKF